MAVQTGPNRDLANAAFMIGTFTILGALSFQYIGGFMPCELCYAQRVPYYVGLPVLALVLILWARLSATIRAAGLGLCVLIFGYGAYLALNHSGVEMGYWPGPDTCSGTGGGLSFDQLDNIDATRVVPCDKPQYPIAGLPVSFAVFNAILTILITGLLLAALSGVWKHRKA